MVRLLCHAWQTREWQSNVLYQPEVYNPTMIVPLEDRVLIQPADPESRTKGGVLLPDKAKEVPMKGKVLAVGPGKIGPDGKHQPMGLKKGDEVLYQRFMGTFFKDDDGIEYNLIDADHILARIER